MIEIIPDFTEVIDGRKYIKGKSGYYPESTVNVLKIAKDAKGNQAYPFSYVKKESIKDKKGVKEDGNK